LVKNGFFERMKKRWKAVARVAHTCGADFRVLSFEYIWGKVYVHSSKDGVLQIET